MRKAGALTITVLFIVFLLSVPTVAVKSDDTNTVINENNPHDNTGPPDPGGKDAATGRPESPGNSDQSNGSKGTQPDDPGSSDNNGRQNGKNAPSGASSPSENKPGPAGTGPGAGNNTNSNKIIEIAGIASEVQGPFAAALHLLPPLGESIENKKSFDRTLTDYLNVTICEIQDDRCVAEYQFTSQRSNGGLDYIKIQNHHYHVNWMMGNDNLQPPYRIYFSVAGLEIGFIDYSAGTNRTVPIRFQIDNVPEIRIRVMREKGFSAEEIALVLKNEFGLSKEDTADLLAGENFTRTEIGEAIIVVYELDAGEGAVFLYSIGYSARETYDVLMNVFAIEDELEIEGILDAAGFKSSEYVDFTALRSIRRFTPVLKFDGSYKGIPMSAQDYFQSMLTIAPNNPASGQITWTVPWDGPSPCYVEGRVRVCSRDECNCGMQNTDFSTLTYGEVPTYYKAISDRETTGEGRLRIAYYWFYGFQQACSWVDGCPGEDGSHHGDWERIIVTTSPNRTRADYVTYEFHGDRYTRKWGSFEMVGVRPVAYVGKVAHGNYHSNEISGWMAGTPHYCCEYADYRNPHSDTIWYNTTGNLVSLRGDAEPWLMADRVGSGYEYNGEDYTISGWRWGPHISYCDWWLFGCMDWEHNTACSTHPTIYPLGWSMRSCSAEGCGVSTCKGLVYTHDAYYNQGWPWDS